MKSRNKLPTIREVAEAAGVSPMTVSRVLNNQQWVKEATRERVQATIRELDYVANEMGRHIRRAKHPCIGNTKVYADSLRKAIGGLFASTCPEQMSQWL